MFPCYAFKLANGRLKERYLNNGLIACDYEGGEDSSDSELKAAFADPFYPRFWPERLEQPYKIKKPVGIFLDDMSDWMGDYWPEEWTQQELQMMKDNPQHRIYTLTKQPQNLTKFSPFPENCWVGVTVTNDLSYGQAIQGLNRIEASIKYLSIEPLLEPPAIVHLTYGEVINWVIIGACTGTMKDLLPLHHRTGLPLIKWRGNKWILSPPMGAVEEIVSACDKAGIPVFMKNNLKPLFAKIDSLGFFEGSIYKYWYRGVLRQEMPV